MEPTITVYCKNTHTYHEVPRGISLIELKDKIGVQLRYPIIAAHVNYKVENLDFLLYKPKDVEFLDASSPSGMRCYVRTLNMILACAINEFYPNLLICILCVFVILINPQSTLLQSTTVKQKSPLPLLSARYDWCLLTRSE